MFHAIVGDNLHEMSELIFLEKYEKIFQKWHLLKFLPSMLSINRFWFEYSTFNFQTGLPEQ